MARKNFWIKEERLMPRKDILALLKKFDRDIEKAFPVLYNSDKEKFHVIIIGGAALILTGYVSKKTVDIDVIEASDTIERYIRESGLETINMKSAVFLYNLPEDYMDRLVSLDLGEKTKRIDYYSASLEDIVVSKLASYRDKDIEDIRTPKILESIDWGLLDKLISEKMETALNKEHASILKAMYREYSQDAERYFQSKESDSDIEPEEEMEQER